MADAGRPSQERRRRPHPGDRHRGAPRRARRYRDTDGVSRRRRVRRRTSTPRPRSTPSAIAGVDLESGTGGIVALDAATGQVLWENEYDVMALGAVTAINDLVFSSTYDGRMFALDARDRRGGLVDAVTGRHQRLAGGSRRHDRRAGRRRGRRRCSSHSASARRVSCRHRRRRARAPTARPRHRRTSAC